MQKRDPDVGKYAFDILRQAAAGLAHMHGKGYMHMDVKPENLMVHKLPKGGLEVQLTDFDLSRPAETKKVDSTGGTELYVPPEQLVDRVISPAGDVFAFGVMAYNLVTGKMPFIGTTELERKQRQISATFMPPEPVTFNKDLAPKLSKLIMQCLQKTREKRLPSMTYVNAELR
jgi:serine/threonine-protein kinase